MDKILVMDQESQSFLPGTEKRASTSEFLNTQPHKKNWMSWHTIITKISLHLFIVILYTIISVATVRMNLHRCSNKTSDVPHGMLICDSWFAPDHLLIYLQMCSYWQFWCYLRLENIRSPRSVKLFRSSYRPFYRRGMDQASRAS